MRHRKVKEIPRRMVREDSEDDSYEAGLESSNPEWSKESELQEENILEEKRDKLCTYLIYLNISKDILKDFFLIYRVGNEMVIDS